MWFVGITGMSETEKLDHIMDKIMIVDQYFGDIKDRLFVNLDTLVTMLKSVFVGGNVMTMQEFLSNLATSHNCFMISSPSLGFFRGEYATTQESFLNYVFKPIAYNDIVTKKGKDEDYGLIIMLGGNPSGTLTNLDNDKESDFENTSLQLTYEDKMLSLNKNKDIYALTNIPLRSFGVSYGRHNESFFEIKRLSNAEPKMTEQYIKSLVRILETAKTYSRDGIYVGEDLYDQYSKLAYSVTVDLIGGSAPLFPLMYFQLNNTYLFTGGYMIFKVTHRIEDNFMITSFEGVKQDFTKREIVTIPYIQSIVGDLRSRNVLRVSFNRGEISDEYKGEIDLNNVRDQRGGGKHLYGPNSFRVTPIRDDRVLGDEYSELKDKRISNYYKLSVCVESGSGNNKSVAGREMPIECFHNAANFMIQVDKIRDWVKSERGVNSIVAAAKTFDDGVEGMEGCEGGRGGSEFDLSINSMWRHHSNKNVSITTYHGYGSAVDLRLLHKRKGQS
jgi:hypothetical protein